MMKVQKGNFHYMVHWIILKLRRHLVVAATSQVLRLEQLSETTSSMENFNGFRLRGYPMIGIVLGGGWGLKFRFADFSLLETKSKEGWTKTSVAGVNGSTFGMGVSKNIDFRRKN